MFGQNPGQNIQVTVSVSSVTKTADTTGVSYVLTNLSASAEPVWHYYVDAPGGVVRMTPSTGLLEWRTSAIARQVPVASWMFYNDYLNPGTATPQLHFESTGLPGILSYRAGGWFPVPVGGDELQTDTSPVPDQFFTNTITGKTVGVDAWPVDRTSKALIARLRTLTQTSCAVPLKWVTVASLCTNLITYLDQAETYRAAGNATKAKSTMATYIKALTGKTAGTFATGVTNPGYWLLKPNADIVVSKL